AMSEDRPRSRPTRLAATLVRREEVELEHLFLSSRVLVRLEEDYSEIQDARETFLLAVNQVLRFCPNVSVGLAALGNQDLLEACGGIASSIHGPEHRLRAV